MFSFVDIRLALLLSAAVLLAKGQGEDDSKYQTEIFFCFFLFIFGWNSQDVDNPMSRMLELLDV